jgi:hypothetical protein
MKNTPYLAKKSWRVAAIFFAFALFTIGGSCALAAGATLSFSPSGGSYKVGDTFTVKIILNSGGSPGVNAADGAIYFDNTLLNVVKLSKDVSVFNLWTTEPAFSNANGSISFSGGSPAAYAGNAGTVMSATFKAMKEGTAQVKFTAGSALAADGKGTDILSQRGVASFTITAKQAAQPVPAAPAPAAPASASEKATGATAAVSVHSDTHPDENHWYNNNSPVFYWKLPEDAKAVKLLFNQESKSNPTVLYSPAVAEKKVEGVEDGIWYLHVQLKNGAGWGDVVHRKVMIDTQKPYAFSIDIKQKDPTDNYPILLFSSNDDLSGIVYYEVKIGDGDPFQISVENVRSNPYRMPFQAPGDHSVVVKAFDAAGNVVEATTTVPVEAVPSPPTAEAPCQAKVSSYDVKISTWLGILIGVLLLVSLFMLDRLFRKHKRSEGKKKVIKEKLQETRKKTKEIFSALKEEIEEQVKHADQKPKMSKTEGHVADRLKEAVDISEELIKREIEEIEKDL